MPLWVETMLFLISLLHPEVEDKNDLLLRNFLSNISARTQDWGTLLNQLLAQTLAINAQAFCGKVIVLDDDAER